MRRLLILTLLAPAVAAPAAAAQTPPADPAPEPRIAPGIAAGGIELGDLTVAEAAARLDGALGERLNRDVVVFAGVGRYRLTAREAGFAFDAERTARRALYEGRRRPAAPVRPGGGGAVAGTDVGLAL